MVVTVAIVMNVGAIVVGDVGCVMVDALIPEILVIVRPVSPEEDRDVRDVMRVW